MPRTQFEERQKQNVRGNRGTEKKKKSFRKRAVDAPTWDEISATAIHTLVCLCTTYGASPTFSYTRDGSTLCIAVYHDGQRYVDYIAGNSEVEEYLNWLGQDLFELNDTDLAYYPFFAAGGASDASPAQSETNAPQLHVVASPGAAQNENGRQK